ncbi:hypothetical protein IPM62_05330 [Candidatus Woesebacteria bacterium]|nr:MAG: hypothetical protein IPM62_05330 [Candidatus Woesebacteria bacterium]
MAEEVIQNTNFLIPGQKRIIADRAFSVNTPTDVGPRLDIEFCAPEAKVEAKLGLGNTLYIRGGEKAWYLVDTHDPKTGRDVRHWKPFPKASLSPQWVEITDNATSVAFKKS